MNSMNAKKINTLVNQLPPGEQFRAKQRIGQAVKYGWQEIGFWDWEWKDDRQPRLDDLVGFDAGGRFEGTSS